MPNRLQIFPPENWQELYTGSVSSGTTEGGGRIPIGPFDVPVIANKPVILAYGESETARKSWRWAGSLQQVYPSPTFSNEEVLADRYRFWLNQTTLIELKDRGAGYQLRLTAPPWLDDLVFTLWEYVGPLGAAALEPQQLAEQLGALNEALNDQGIPGVGPDWDWRENLPP